MFKPDCQVVAVWPLAKICDFSNKTYFNRKAGYPANWVNKASNGDVELCDESNYMNENAFHNTGK